MSEFVPAQGKQQGEDLVVDDSKLQVWLQFRFLVSTYACRYCLRLTDRNYMRSDGKQVIACRAACAKLATN